jgi:hypothetical protein
LMHHCSQSGNCHPCRTHHFPCISLDASSSTPFIEPQAHWGCISTRYFFFLMASVSQFATHFVILLSLLDSLTMGKILLNNKTQSSSMPSGSGNATQAPGSPFLPLTSS